MPREFQAHASDEIELPEKQPCRGFDANGPKFVQYFGPLLDALRALGGAAEPRSAMDKVVELAGITEQELGGSTKNGQSRYENEVGWARVPVCSKAANSITRESGFGHSGTPESPAVPRTHAPADRVRAHYADKAYSLNAVHTANLVQAIQEHLRRS